MGNTAKVIAKVLTFILTSSLAFLIVYLLFIFRVHLEFSFVEIPVLGTSILTELVFLHVRPLCKLRRRLVSNIVRTLAVVFCTQITPAFQNAILLLYLAWWVTHNTARVPVLMQMTIYTPMAPAFLPVTLLLLLTSSLVSNLAKVLVLMQITIYIRIIPVLQTVKFL